MVDALVIGGGFYGVAIAIHLAKHKKLSRVVLMEREPKLLARASYNNQARVHNGYHYPRSFTTAFRSRINLPRFFADHSAAIKSDFIKVYAIARCNSKITAKQFRRFCQEIGAKLEPAPQSIRTLFEPSLIEEIFLVEEYAFDANKLAALALAELQQAGVELHMETCVTGISAAQQNSLSIEFTSAPGITDVLTARYVFNCTYSGLNQFTGHFPGTQAHLKHEIAEMALLQLPPILATLGITVMDGPFFSMMPFPSRELHTLSHVRYTPHCYWYDQPPKDPYAKLAQYHKETRVDRMLRDTARYLPAIVEAKYIDSLFEIKTVLVKNEGDDGRPILFERHEQLPNCYSILGGKIDNIYDVLEKINAETI